MTTHTVEITAQALAEVEMFFDQIAVRSPQAAVRWHERWRMAFASLQTLPERCPLAPENEWHPVTLRQHFTGKRQNTYRILFEVVGNVVYIVRVRHGRQDLLTEGDL